MPGEKLNVRIIKSKKAYAEAIAEDVIVASDERRDPRDSEFLATSPWQILSTESEQKAKLAIVRELLSGAKMANIELNFFQSKKQWHYRNKMEYSFFGDEDGLHLALHQRGSRSKLIVSGSSLADKRIDMAAQALVNELDAAHVWAGCLKSVIIRTTKTGDVAASLFTTKEDLRFISSSLALKGLKIYYSNPKSPASVPTKLISSSGNTVLSDEILGRYFSYDADSFFQVNLDTYEGVLKRIRQEVGHGNVVDMYAGVGTIGLSSDAGTVELIEINEISAGFARRNAEGTGLRAKIIVSGAETATEHIKNDQIIIFDPPRAGLHRKLIQAILEKLPAKIVYLSCNPATLVRDLSLLSEAYEFCRLDIFNFFPKTPHIESLVVLNRKNKAMH